MDFTNYLKHYPNAEGRFGNFGGAYLPEQLVPAFKEITEAYLTICQSSKFITEKMSRELTGKLLKLTSEANAGKLKRNLRASGRVRSGNEKGYYIVDAINEAINYRLISILILIY